MAGTGVVVYDSSYLSWWGFRVHDVGGAGMYLTGIKKASDHLDFKGTSTTGDTTSSGTRTP